MKTTPEGFLICPKCGKKTKVKVLAETELHRFPVFCPWCKSETIINYNRKQAGA